MKYEATIDLSNKNNSHTLIYDQICKNSPSRPLRILEVGCSSGYLGAALAKEGHEVWGVEPNTEAANAARQVLYRVFTGFLDDFLDSNAEIKFDVIIFGDVLEHLVDPEAALKKCAAFLSDEGVVVASIPNVTHFSIRAMMLEGRWEYSDLGILDRTHMRFFTRRSIVELFSESQYDINEIKSVKLPVAVAAELGGFSLSRESVDAVVSNSRDATGYDFQYVLSARPSSMASCGTRLCTFSS